MYSVILLCAAATGGEAAACPPRVCHRGRAVYYHSPVIYHQPPVVHSPAPPIETGEEPAEPDAKVHPQTEADKRMLKEMMGWVTDPKERKKVMDYWLAPGVDSQGRKEFYLEVKKKATGDDSDEEEVAAEDAPCTIVVTLPEDAKLYIEGEATTSTGPARTFVSPKLPSGKTYLYTLTALMERDGEVVSVTRTVRVWAGSMAEVTIE
jgi:uncharacterized protein (TIGR03000 family)